MNTNKSDIIIKMKKLQEYFFRNSKTNELFIPENDAALLIINLVEQQLDLTLQTVNSIIAIYNNCISNAHYDGSGWFDFQLQLICLIRINGLNIKVEPSGKLILI